MNAELERPLIVVSANVNGLTSALQNGFFGLPHIKAADVLCLQETRSDDAVTIGRELGFEAIAANTAGHGGVAIFATSPIVVNNEHLTHYGPEQSGQFVSGSVAGVNFGSMSVTRSAEPDQFRAFSELFERLNAGGASTLLCGDMNTFRDGRDAWNFEGAMEKGGIGCDPVAMAWFAGVFANGWIDAVEAGYPQRPLYTWWQRNDLFRRGDGTRRDYILASPPANARVAEGSAAVMTEHRFGGHAQIMLTLN